MFETQMQQSLSETKLRRYRYFKGAEGKVCPTAVEGSTVLNFSFNLGGGQNFVSPARVLV